MTDKLPLVSVVIIAYNEEKHLSDAIESVLNQTYPSIEVIVVDDGSTDNTFAVASRYENQVKVIKQKNSGGCSSPRNTGLRNSSGQYVAFLDADDILVPEKISLQMDIFLANPSVHMVIGNYKNFRGSEEYSDHFSSCPELMSMFNSAASSCIFFAEGAAAELLINENFSIAGSPLYVTSDVLQLGGFDESLKACEDFHLIYRMAQRHSVAVDKRVIFHRRLHSSNMSSNQLKMLRFYCLSRLSLASQEIDQGRKSLLMRRVYSYFRNYIGVVFRARSVAHVQYVGKIFTKLLTSTFSK